MSATYNYTEKVLNALKFYSLGMNDNGALAKATLPLAGQVTEQFADAVTIINNLMAEKPALKELADNMTTINMLNRELVEGSTALIRDSNAAQLTLTREIRRLQELCKKHKISYKKPAGKKKK